MEEEKPFEKLHFEEEQMYRAVIGSVWDLGMFVLYMDNKMENTFLN